MRAGPRWETPDPPGVRGTYGDQVIAWARERLGIVPGPWQAYALRRILRYDRNGDLIARVALLSTGRQNGKSIIVRLITGWMLDDGQKLDPFRGWTTILAAAHDAKQARIIYSGVLRDIEGNPALKAASRTSVYRGITRGNIDFDIVTSQPGSARGWSAGLIDWDEVVTQRDWDMWEALSPTQSAQRSPLMLLTSTAGRADSVVLRAFYDRLLRQAQGAEKPDPTFYAAWWQSESPDVGLDWAELQRANPALGDGRLTRQAITSEHALLPQDSWRRERLNHFVDVVADTAFNPAVWAACRTSSPPLEGADGPYAMGVDIAPGWDRATIAVAGQRSDGRIGVEVYRDIVADGRPITAARIIEEVQAFPEPLVAVAFDAVSGAGPAFGREGEPWREHKPNDVRDACMDVAEMILSGRLAVRDPLLDTQIASTVRTNVGSEGAFRFSRSASTGPIDAVMAMSFAAHAIASESMPNIR